MSIKSKDDTVSTIFNEVAHQWRQPLAQINSNVIEIDNILYDLNIKDSRLEERLVEIEQLTKHMSKTIDDFKEKNSEKSIYDIEKTLEELKSIVTPNLRKNSIHLTINIENNFSYYSNSRDILQVLLLLVNNAIDALLERNVFEKKIDINVKTDTKSSYIEVIDNAGGISQKSMERIFNDDYSTKHNSVGSGLGLSMARKIIIEKYSGDLSVKNFEKGSCFEIVLNLEYINKQ